MASFVGAIEQFNPYIQQIPTEAYTRVGMFKEQQYQAGLEKVQSNIDKIAGLDIANEGGRNYLRNKVDELTKTLNIVGQNVDYSNPNNVAQLVSLAKPLYQDENIVNDVINTGVYRKWNKDAMDAYKLVKMELGQYMRESSDASVWLNSQVAGAQYTGRSTPNTATKKELIDRIIKAKKDGLEKNEYVYDINYSMDTPYYVKSTNKYYSEADFNNFITNNIITEKDREMLMNGHWYENQGKSTLKLQQEDLAMYQAKIDANNSKIEYYKSFGDSDGSGNVFSNEKKMEIIQTIKDLEAYNLALTNGKVKFLQELDLNDPASRDVFHRDISESNFVSSLAILRDEVKKEELQKNEQWFKDKELEIEAAKEAMKAGKTTTGKAKKPEELIDEVAVYTPVDPTAPKTELSLNTIQKGWQMKNDEINNAMNGLIGKLQQNGVDMSQFIVGWDQVQVGNKAGASMNVPRFKDQASKERFYNMVAGLNYAYSKEAEDGHLDNKSFRDFVKTLDPNYQDNDPNSKFTLQDKMVSDALNSLKGTSALIPKLEGLFADKGVTRTLAQIDSALKDKKDMANAYREALYKSNALKEDERKALQNLSDDQILSNSFYLDKDQEERRAGPNTKVSYSVKKEDDGTYSIYQTINKNDVGAATRFFQDLAPEYGTSDIGLGEVISNRKIAGGYKNIVDAQNAERNGGQLQLYASISKETLDKAEQFVKNTYSYVQENLNSTVQNLKQDKDAYAAVQDGLTLFLTRARLQATSQDIMVDGIDDLTQISGINSVEVLGATVSNTEDIFNPNPMYEVQFKASTGEGKDRKEATYSGKVSLRSFLATNPNYKTSDYAKYFAPMLYAEKDAYARIKATVNPLEGSEASYANRQDIDPVFNYVNPQGGTGFSSDAQSQYQWETIPIERDGKQTMVSYQVVSLGQNTNLGNIKNTDGQTYQPGAFYVKLKVPTTNGTPKVIFLKRPNGDSYTFNNASNAHYTVRDLIFNNSEIKFDEVSPSGEINYFTIDPTTLRGIFNAQLSYNGFSEIETIKLKDALGREVQKQQLAANETQFGR